MNQREVMEALLAGRVFILENGGELRLKEDMLVCESGEGDITFYHGSILVNCWKLKPECIQINGYDVPVPVKEPLSIGERYYFVDLVNPVEGVFSYIWNGSNIDYRFLDNGLIHLTKEAMLEHRAALLSFTKEK
jgi:hypothetical protein